MHDLRKVHQLTREVMSVYELTCLQQERAAGLSAAVEATTDRAKRLVQQVGLTYILGERPPRGAHPTDPNYDWTQAVAAAHVEAHTTWMELVVASRRLVELWVERREWRAAKDLASCLASLEEPAAAASLIKQITLCQARAAAADGYWSEARGIVRGWLTGHKYDAEAEALLREITLGQARAALAAGRWSEVRDIVSDWVTDHKGDPEAQELLQQSRVELVRQALEAGDVAAAQLETAVLLREQGQSSVKTVEAMLLEMYLERARRAMNDERWEEAHSVLTAWNGTDHFLYMKVSELKEKTYKQWMKDAMAHDDVVLMERLVPVLEKVGLKNEVEDLRRMLVLRDVVRDVRAAIADTHWHSARRILDKWLRPPTEPVKGDPMRPADSRVVQHGYFSPTELVKGDPMRPVFPGYSYSRPAFAVHPAVDKRWPTTRLWAPGIEDLVRQVYQGSVRAALAEGKREEAVKLAYEWLEGDPDDPEAAALVREARGDWWQQLRERFRR